MPTCNTCEASGQTCEGYQLQWPGLASRGQLVGKSIPVAETTKRRRTRRVQRATVPSPPPPLPQSPKAQDPVNNDQAESQDARFEDLLDPLQLFADIADLATPSDPLIWSNDVSLMNNPSDDLVDPQLNADPESPSQDHSELFEGSLALHQILGPSLDILGIPDELKFIMQYRQFYISTPHIGKSANHRLQISVKLYQSYASTTYPLKIHIANTSSPSPTRFPHYCTHVRR